jgi:hypothetical protein
VLSFSIRTEFILFAQFPTLANFCIFCSCHKLINVPDNIFGEAGAKFHARQTIVRPANANAFIGKADYFASDQPLILWRIKGHIIANVNWCAKNVNKFIHFNLIFYSPVVELI